MNLKVPPQENTGWSSGFLPHDALTESERQSSGWPNPGQLTARRPEVNDPGQIHKYSHIILDEARVDRMK